MKREAQKAAPILPTILLLVGVVLLLGLLWRRSVEVEVSPVDLPTEAAKPFTLPGPTRIPSPPREGPDATESGIVSVPTWREVLKGPLEGMMLARTLVDGMPKHQRNSRVLVESLGRRLFEEDWKLLRLRHPELTEDQGRSLYRRWNHAVTNGDPVDWDSWIPENLPGTPVQTPVDPASSERLQAFYRLRLESQNSPGFRAVAEAVAPHVSADRFWNSGLLMEAWAYVGMHEGAEEWASSQLRQHSRDYSQTPRDDTTLHPDAVPHAVVPVSPAIVAEIEEERRLTESGTRSLVEWRLREIHGIQDPAALLDSLSGIRIGPAGLGDFVLPIP